MPTTVATMTISAMISSALPDLLMGFADSENDAVRTECLRVARAARGVPPVAAGSLDGVSYIIQMGRR